MLAHEALSTEKDDDEKSTHHHQSPGFPRVPAQTLNVQTEKEGGHFMPALAAWRRFVWMKR